MTNFYLEQIERGFLQAFLCDGSVPPVCAVTREGKLVDAFLVMDDRVLFAAMIRALCQRTCADTVMVYSEMWYTQEPVLVLPTDDPKRQEALMAYVETTTGATSKMWPIIRDGSRVTLGASRQAAVSLRRSFTDAEVLGVDKGGGFNFHNLLGRDL